MSCILIEQVLTAEVELSDTPKVDKLTLYHIQGPLALLFASLGVATIIWLGQICQSRAISMTVVKPIKPSRIFHNTKRMPKNKLILQKNPMVVKT